MLGFIYDILNSNSIIILTIIPIILITTMVFMFKLLVKDSKN